MHKVLALSVGLVLVGSYLGASAAPVNRTGAISKFSGVDEIVEACTTSTTYVNLPRMSRMFTVGGPGSAAVAVLFQGALSLSGEDFDTGFVRLQIDGVVQSPGEIPIKNAGALTATHGFNWQSQTLAPGNHTARVQWRTDLGSSLCVDARSLLILHK